MNDKSEKWKKNCPSCGNEQIYKNKIRICKINFVSLYNK